MNAGAFSFSDKLTHNTLINTDDSTDGSCMQGVYLLGAPSGWHATAS